ncbi:hypothetical protein QQS21_005633 [Conoideocrella luteorostrata]|uniref:Uncharacterized protein n=1 Tax=Conoideocrella luteorostrata TaxID=1105319 RepID=A0AAJ0CP70_9HYPO|nr:hypothetical protein QQS21_005633 [Conoideocrella luteorostrata]
MREQDPPTYEQVTSCQPDDHVASNGEQTLTLDGCKIYLSETPLQLLYELNSPPCEAITNTHSLRKVRYRLTDGDGEGQMKQRLDNIYHMKEKASFSLRELRQHIIITGKASQKRCYKEVILTSGLTGWKTCAAKDHFAADIPMMGRLKGSNFIQWKNSDGITVALEIRAKIQKHGAPDGLPQLIIKEALQTKDLDLLVACWTARIWKESKAELYAQLPSDNLKNFTSRKHRQRNVARLGGSTGAASGAFF